MAKPIDPDPLASAITFLSVAVGDLTKQMKTDPGCLKSHSGAVTKEDLKQMEARILKALGERVDPQAVEKLSQASDALKDAVEQNTTQ